MAFKKAGKDTVITLAILSALVIFTVIAFNLSVNAFTVVMPIFAGLIFLAIVFLPEEKEKK